MLTCTHYSYVIYVRLAYSSKTPGKTSEFNYFEGKGLVGKDKEKHELFIGNLLVYRVCVYVCVYMDSFVAEWISISLCMYVFMFVCMLQT